jgi:hypothetical protein
MWTSDQAFVVGECPHCRGSGFSREGRHFFYALGLIAGGILCFFQWPPTATLFSFVWEQCLTLGIPNWVGTAIIWSLTGVPPIFGLAFLWVWMRRDTCPKCNGRSKITRWAPNPVE